MPLRLSKLRWPGAALGMLALGGCSVLGSVAQLGDGYYRVVRFSAADSLAAALPTGPLYVQQRADTVLLTLEVSGGPPRTTRYFLRPTQRLWLRRSRLDVDVFTIPFKLRPAQAGVPVQLNTNFNAALYVGRRLDFYSLRTKRSTPFGATANIRATGLGYGAFAGVGSTLITNDVTLPRPRATEYEGLVVHGGLAAIYDAQVFNIGVAVGLDQLLGPDGPYWAYQRKPWFGVLFGLDLN